jgi:hypothetical protein
MNPNSNSKATSGDPTASGKSLRLEIIRLGNCPSFKNGKKLFLTNDKAKAWMQAAIASLKSQCISKCPTSGRATWTADLRRFLTASLPVDDNWKIIPNIILTCETVSKGEEGVIIEITEI